MKRVVVCFFGVISRSIRYTFESIKSNIIDVLKDNDYEVEIYVFNLNIKDTKIDNIIIDQSDISLIPYNYFEEEYQSKIDNEIECLKKQTQILFTRSDYTDCVVQNCLRQLYSEYRVGLFLERNVTNYDLSIVCGPDFYIANKLNLDELECSYKNNCFYTTLANDAQGYTNGFYFGRPDILIKPLKRLEYISYFMPVHRDYEYILQESLRLNNLSRGITSLMFFKVRANKSVFFRDRNSVYIRFFSNAMFNLILCEYNALIDRLSRL